jgi:pSer/pThr/pTyr-binding forkhead associated (FHA) protein
LIFPAEETVVGRRDSSSFRPDVDLSLWGGYRSGVSRRHALLVRKPGHQLYLVDLGSSNGTFINGERLVPEQPYLLHDGDEIKFGHLVTRVYFEYRTVNR